jgi:hypothetical protein
MIVVGDLNGCIEVLWTPMIPVMSSTHLLRVTTLLAAQSESPPLEGVHFAFAGGWTRWRVTPRSVSRAF